MESEAIPSSMIPLNYAATNTVESGFFLANVAPALSLSISELKLRNLREGRKKMTVDILC